MKSVDLFSASGDSLNASHTDEAQATMMRWQMGPCLRMSYLGAWFEALKESAHYTQMTRTGLFPSEASHQTFMLFGAVEGQSFDQWWELQGKQHFGCGEFPVTPDCLVRYQAEQDGFMLAFRYSVKGYSSVSRLQDALKLVHFACTKVLSQRPVVWPFFKSRVSPAAVFRSLAVARACASAGTRGRVRLYEIGERLGLNRAMAIKAGDRAFERSDKHVVMGKLVSAERARGVALAMNAARGVFPSFANPAKDSPERSFESLAGRQKKTC